MENGQFVPILTSNRKTGFLGFIVCLNSALHLYLTLVKSGKLDYIKLNKISQDHLKLYFGDV